MDQERLKQRAAGREQARQILGLVELPSQNHIDAFIDELLTTLCPKVLVEEHKQEKRTIRQLSEVRMSFGKHFGERLEDVPRDYLHWLVEQQENTLASVVEYLDLTKDQDE